MLSCADGCAFDTSACWATRFEDNADGTITDNVSGLMWEKKTELGGGANLANPHDADNIYQAIVDYADTTLPAVNVAFEGASCGVACTDITSAACSCTEASSGFYWSASSLAHSPSAAWAVGFASGGNVVGMGKSIFSRGVRAVRGGS